MQKRGCLRTRQPTQKTRHIGWSWIEMPTVRTLTLMSACCQAQLKLQSQDAAHIKPFTSRKEPRPSLTAVKGQHRPARPARPPARRITRREWKPRACRTHTRTTQTFQRAGAWHHARRHLDSTTVHLHVDETLDLAGAGLNAWQPKQRVGVQVINVSPGA